MFTYHCPLRVSFPPTINPNPSIPTPHSISKTFSNSCSPVSVKAHCWMILRVKFFMDANILDSSQWSNVGDISQLVSPFTSNKSLMQSFSVRSTNVNSGNWSKVRPFIDLIRFLPNNNLMSSISPKRDKLTHEGQLFLNSPAPWKCFPICSRPNCSKDIFVPILSVFRNLAPIFLLLRNLKQSIAPNMEIAWKSREEDTELFCCC